MFIESLTINPDVICLFEHWIHNGNDFLFHKINGCILAASFSWTFAKDGRCVCCLLRGSLQSWKLSWIDLIWKSSWLCSIIYMLYCYNCCADQIKSVSAVIVYLYRSPINYKLTLNIFYEWFQSMISHCCLKYCKGHIIIPGDFKINVLLAKSSKLKMLNIINSHLNFFPHLDV